MTRVLPAPLRLAGGVLLAAFALLAGGPPPASADDSGSRPTAEAPAEALVARLDSPFAAAREGAVDALLAQGARARAALLAALPTATPLAKEGILAVLGEDGSPEAVDALLAEVEGPTDPALAWAASVALVQRPEAAEARLRARFGDGSLPAALGGLAALLRRARTEALFLSRKSPTGGTGSYPGQYEVLRADREMALEVCLSVLLDRALKAPGVFPAGSYRWLRPPRFHSDRLELQHMAVNAIAEIGSSEDEGVVRGLAAFHRSLSEIVEERGRLRALVEAGLLDAVLTTLARLAPGDWRGLAVDQMRLLALDSTTLDDAAAMALRLGEYRTAVRHYQRLRAAGDGALASYNLACAYARWSREFDGEDAEHYRGEAVRAMEAARDEGYADWAWMEQDRDLDAIREEPRFRAVVEGLRREFPPKAPLHR